MNCSVIGCGRWGSFIAWYLCRAGHAVTLYGRPGSRHLAEFRRVGTNGLVTLQKEIRLTDSLAEALEAELVVISVGAQSFRGVMKELSGRDLSGKTFLLCMKGIEMGTGKRLTQVAAEEAGPVPTAVWVGPGHVQEFVAGVPNCMLIDSADPALTARLVDLLSTDLIRFYYGADLIGTEVGAAAKNVVGLAAGMLDGLGRSSLKGALMARGTREVARLIQAMGGNQLSAYGLCHLGDYEATVFSRHSHNRACGEAFVKGEPYHALAEGVYTCRAMLELGERYGVELPICQAVDRTLRREEEPARVLEGLFLRSLKKEF